MEDSFFPTELRFPDLPPILYFVPFCDLEITSDQLTQVLRDKYGLSNQECDSTLNSLGNIKGVDIHTNKFTK